ncbi:MAG TPA: chromate resistance protein ChrB domain-containing protein [Gemmatimonadales bacterium]|nr:chromate resistance protein ChrB domain-containing protein [Gemmatimonadales bacterium]
MRAPASGRWLLLFHQIPPKPDYVRVKVWRRLQRLGAVPVKNAVWVLPYSEQALEDFRWLLEEIVAGGGVASLCRGEFVDGLRVRDIEALFRRRRRRRAIPRPRAATPRGARVRGRTWVTRRGVFVDRIASAWLIARYIDPQARFKFVAPEGYIPRPGELRFDMFEAEYTHHGDACTFETLLARFRLRGPALRAIAEIVHDIDCKDGKFHRRETAAVARRLARVARTSRTDHIRLRRGATVFDELYRTFDLPPRRAAR